MLQWIEDNYGWAWGWRGAVLLGGCIAIVIAGALIRDWAAGHGWR